MFCDRIIMAYQFVCHGRTNERSSMDYVDRERTESTALCQCVEMIMAFRRMTEKVENPKSGE